MRGLLLMDDGQRVGVGEQRRIWRTRVNRRRLCGACDWRHALRFFVSFTERRVTGEVWNVVRRQLGTGRAQGMRAPYSISIYPPPGTLARGRAIWQDQFSHPFVLGHSSLVSSVRHAILRPGVVIMFYTSALERIRLEGFLYFAPSSIRRSSVRWRAHPSTSSTLSSLVAPRVAR